MYATYQINDTPPEYCHFPKLFSVCFEGKSEGVLERQEESLKNFISAFARMSEILAMAEVLDDDDLYQILGVRPGDIRIDFFRDDMSREQIKALRETFRK